METEELASLAAVAISHRTSDRPPFISVALKFVSEIEGQAEQRTMGPGDQETRDQGTREPGTRGPGTGTRRPVDQGPGDKRTRGSEPGD